MNKKAFSGVKYRRKEANIQANESLPIGYITVISARIIPYQV
jgi:hypothetical protein